MRGALGSVLLLACGATQKATGTASESLDSGLRTPGELVTADGWVSNVELDPWPEHRTADHSCDERGILVEDGLLEVRTGDCGYVVLSQPTLRAVRRSDTIELLLYHSALTAAESAEAHVAFHMGDVLVWETTLPIPSPSLVHDVVVPAPAAAPIGTMMVLHLHNHGSNAWNLAHLRVRH